MDRAWSGAALPGSESVVIDIQTPYTQEHTFVETHLLIAYPCMETKTHEKAIARNFPYALCCSRTHFLIRQ